MKKIFYTLGLTLLFASCSDEYLDWANPQQNGDEGVKTVTMAVTPAEPIDYANVTTDSVKLFNTTVTAEGEPSTSYDVTVANPAINMPGIEMKGDAKCQVSAEELKSAIEKLYGKRPVARTPQVIVTAYATIDGQAIKKVGETTASVLLVAPVIEDAYYVIGSVNEWNSADKTYKLVNGGGDVYEDPVFTVKIPAEVVTSDIEFKLNPESGLGSWDKCITAAEDGAEGFFATDNKGGNLKVAYNKDAKYYQLSFNMLEGTWTSEAIAFAPYIYEIGDNTGWSSACPLACPNMDGKYKGFAWLNGEYKYKPNGDKDNWTGDWEFASGDAMSGTMADNNGSNLPAPATGFYMMDVDLNDMSYANTLISTVGLIGDATPGQWDTSTPMAYNEAEGCWEISNVTLTDGTIKLRANNGWDINWGGSLDNLIFNAGNIAVSAGTYDIKAFIKCDGMSYVTMTKK